MLGEPPATAIQGVPLSLLYNPLRPPLAAAKVQSSVAVNGRSQHEESPVAGEENVFLSRSKDSTTWVLLGDNEKKKLHQM